MANHTKAGRIDQSEQPPNPHRGGVYRIQEDADPTRPDPTHDQTDPTTVGEEQIAFNFLSNNSFTIL